MLKLIRISYLYVFKIVKWFFSTVKCNMFECIVILSYLSI